MSSLWSDEANQYNRTWREPFLPKVGRLIVANGAGILWLYGGLVTAAVWHEHGPVALVVMLPFVGAILCALREGG